MVTIKCQRLNSDKELEEVEIEVPANIYENLQSDNEVQHKKMTSVTNKSLGSRLKCLLLREP